MKKFVAILLAALPFAAAPSTSSGRYPDRPLRLVVPFAPGGGNDVLARLLATELAEGLAQQTIVENRAGASGVTATESVAKAAPDGYTLLLGFVGPLALSPAVGKVPYDSVRDFTGLGLLASSYHILVINPAVPARTVRELIDLAKRNPGRLNYASSGTGANLHLTTELFRNATGIDIVHIPYKGAGPAASAVLAGEAQIVFGSIASSLAYVRAGRVIALAVTSPERSPLAPEVPTLAESGIEGVDVPSWYTLLVPARTPAEPVRRLRAELAKIAAKPAFREQLARQAIEVRTIAPDEYAAFVKKELEKWRRVVNDNNIKAD